MYAVHAIEDDGSELMIGAAATLAGAEAIVSADCDGGDIRWRQEPGHLPQEVERYVADTAGGRYSVGHWQLEA